MNLPWQNTCFQQVSFSPQSKQHGLLEEEKWYPPRRHFPMTALSGLEIEQHLIFGNSSRVRLNSDAIASNTIQQSQLESMCFHEDLLWLKTILYLVQLKCFFAICQKSLTKLMSSSVNVYQIIAVGGSFLKMLQYLSLSENMSYADTCHSTSLIQDSSSTVQIKSALVVKMIDEHLESLEKLSTTSLIPLRLRSGSPPNREILNSESGEFLI